MEQYVKYLRKSRFDRDYAELSVEETLKRHEDILDNLARSRGYHIAKTYYEVVSGESIAARPEVQKLLEEVSAGIYAGVLVVDLERLARGNGADQAYISQVFQYSETKIITPLKTYDPTNEFDEEYFEFGLFMSRREYKTINRRLIRGRDSSASEGKYLGSIAPYGYNKVKLEGEKGFTLEIEPEEAKYVVMMYDMFIRGYGTKIIANHLNDLGVPTRRGDLWTYSTVSNIITNPVYMGKIRRGWSKTVKTLENGEVRKRIKRKKNIEDYQLFDGKHPAIISEKIFYQAQSIRKGKVPSVKVKDDFQLQNVFAGLIFCAECGKRIGRTTSSRGVPRFRCVNERNCHNSSAYYDVVEQQIIEALRGWLDGYKVKIETIGFRDEIQECKDRIENLDREEEKLSNQLDKAFTLVEQGVYSLEVFKERREKLTNSIENIKVKKRDLSELMTKMEESDTIHSNLVPQTEKLLESYDVMSVDERNKILKEVLHKIVYKKERDGKICIDLYPRLPRI